MRAALKLAAVWRAQQIRAVRKLRAGAEVPLPLPSLPLAPRSKPKGALSRSSPSISKSVSFSETRLLKQRHIEMLAAVAIQSWSQSLDLRPLKRNDFLDQCLLSGLLEVGRPESGQLGSEGPVFDPVALSQEDEAGMKQIDYGRSKPTKNCVKSTFAFVLSTCPSPRCSRRASLTCRST